MCKQIIYKSLTMSMIWFVCLLPVTGFAQDNLSVVPVFDEAHANSIYEVKFTTSQEIAPTARFLITFPKTFDLSKVSMAGSQTINGGFTTTVKDSTILIKRSGLGETVNVGETVQIQFATIRNPGIPRDYSIKVEIKSDSDEIIAQKRNAVQIKKRADKK